MVMGIWECDTLEVPEQTGDQIKACSRKAEGCPQAESNELIYFFNTR